LNGIQADETTMAKARAARALARNQSQSHLDKREDIVRTATALFLESGYEVTSIQRIAAEVEVAPNTLYWYFEDKDALLIGVLDSLLAQSLAEYQQRKKTSLEAQLLWLVDHFSSLQKLIATVHSRIATSDSLRTWHDGFHRLLEAIIEEQLRTQGLARGHEAYAAKATMFVVEGLLAHEVGAAERRKLVKWLVSVAR
jgi:AcrR family transcriptional regulator